MPAFEGRCHCGAIGYRFTTDLPPADWTVRACRCSFCRAHDVVSTSDPDGCIEFTAGDPQALQRYRFGLLTADFLVCRRCGTYVGATIETDQRRFGIVNLRALTDVPEDLAWVRPVSYESEDVDARTARRARRWTPVSRD